MKQFFMQLQIDFRSCPGRLFDYCCSRTSTIHMWRLINTANANAFGRHRRGLVHPIRPL